MVDAVYYKTVYLGQEAAECDLPALIARAEDVIGAMTRWQATADTFDTLTPMQKTLVKKAICAQVDAFAVNGLDSLSGGSGTGFTVGRVSVSGKSGSDLAHRGKMAEYIAPLAILYLEQSGLMAPQVATGPDMPMVGWW